MAAELKWSRRHEAALLGFATQTWTDPAHLGRRRRPEISKDLWVGSLLLGQAHKRVGLKLGRNTCEFVVAKSWDESFGGHGRRPCCSRKCWDPAAMRGAEEVSLISSMPTFSCGCFYELGSCKLGVLLVKALLFGIYIGLLIFGNFESVARRAVPSSTEDVAPTRTLAACNRKHDLLDSFISCSMEKGWKRG